MNIFSIFFSWCMMSNFLFSWEHLYRRRLCRLLRLLFLLLSRLSLLFFSRAATLVSLIERAKAGSSCVMTKKNLIEIVQPSSCVMCKKRGRRAKKKKQREKERERRERSRLLFFRIVVKWKCSLPDAELFLFLSVTFSLFSLSLSFVVSRLSRSISHSFFSLVHSRGFSERDNWVRWKRSFHSIFFSFSYTPTLSSSYSEAHTHTHTHKYIDTSCAKWLIHFVHCLICSELQAPGDISFCRRGKTTQIDFLLPVLFLRFRHRSFLKAVFMVENRRLRRVFYHFSVLKRRI